MTGANVTETYYVFLVSITFLLYLVVAEENVAKYLWLQFKILVINIKKLWLWIQIYPKLQYNRWVLMRTLKKAMKQLEDSK